MESKQITKQDIENCLNDILSSKVKSKDREFKLWVYGTEEQCKEAVLNFNKAMKEAVNNYNINETK
jgi:hypothetical protein